MPDPEGPDSADGPSGSDDLYDRIWKRKTALSQGEAGEPVGKGPGPRTRNALPHVPEGARVLDLGCGSGGLLAAVPSPKAAVGADLAWPALREARKRGLAVVRATLENRRLPFRSDAFDRVTCMDVVEHLFDPRPLLGEAHRVLRPGGLLVLQTPNVRHWHQVWRIAVRGRGPSTSGDPEGIDGGHLHYFTFRDVVDLLHEAGFADVETTGTEGVRWLAAIRSQGVLALARKVA